MRGRRYSFNSADPQEQTRQSQRMKAMWEAQDLQQAARPLSDSAHEHSDAELLKAITLYMKAQKLWDLLGNRSHEVRCCQYAIDAIRLTIASNRATAAVKAATGQAKTIGRPELLRCCDCNAPLDHGVCPDCPAPRDEYDPIDDRSDIR